MGLTVLKTRFYETVPSALKEISNKLEVLATAEAEMAKKLLAPVVESHPETTSQGNNFLPYWDEERQGVVIPVIGKVLDAKNLSKKAEKWDASMQLATAAGKALPSKKEMYALLFFKDEINDILKKHGGDLLESCFWASTECSGIGAWYTSFPTGYGNYYRYTANYVRAVAAI